MNLGSEDWAGEAKRQGWKGSVRRLEQGQSRARTGLEQKLDQVGSLVSLLPYEVAGRSLFR